MAAKPPLRVALLIDGFEQPAWVKALLTQLVAAQDVELVAVILNAAPAPKRQTISRRLAAYGRNLLYVAYTRFDEWRAKSVDDPFAPTSVADLLATVPQIVVQPRQTRHCDYFEAGDIDQIRSFRIDVAIRLGFRILRGEALRISRFGVWSFHHADNTANRGGPPGFWEVAEQSPVTGAVLQILSEDLDNGRVIYRSYSSTNQFSVARNLRSSYWKSVAFIPRKLKDVYERGAEALTDPVSHRFTTYSKRLYVQPTNAEMLRVLPRVITRYAGEKIRALGSRDQWFLAYKFRRPGSADGEVPDATFYNFREIVPPLDRFWADPFPIQHDGGYSVFFEEFPYGTAKGHISVISLDRNGEIGPPQVALEKPYHLSYPHIFQWRGALYMLPEAAESGSVQLYRCATFPNQWEPAGVPLEGTPGADPTVVEVGGRWWLFLTLASPHTDCWDDELYLYVADTPLGPWRPHAKNPVKSDVRSARSAGRIFSHRGDLYRPAQDCSVRYGYGITINRIVRIDETAFEEVPEAVVRPEWRRGLRATHTLNAAGDLTVTDGQWRRSVLFRTGPGRNGPLLTQQAKSARRESV